MNSAQGHDVGIMWGIGPEGRGGRGAHFVYERFEIFFVGK